MKITGIITEYNPMHNGHIYHLEQTKKICKSDAIVCVMSGNFVQRGEPALIDKWSRAKAALYSGIDLVIELPCIYALSSAEFFAYGAISLLNSIGIIDNVCFGSEIGDTKIINSIADILSKEPIEYKTLLKYYLDKGFSFPAARMNSIAEFTKGFENSISHDLINSLMTSPNNVLGIEYCKSLKKLNSKIEPYTIKRLGSSYNDSNITNLPSATSIRNHLKDSGDIKNLENIMPEPSLQALKANIKSLTFLDEIFNFVKYKIITDKNSLKNIPDISEGLHNKIFDSFSKNSDMSSAVNFIKTKRYTYTRITRILNQLYIGFDCYNTEILRKLPCPYARVLGFNSTGQKLLKEMKTKSSIPTIVKVPKNLNETLDLDIKATMAYSLINSSVDIFEDYLKKPVII